MGAPIARHSRTRAGAGIARGTALTARHIRFAYCGNGGGTFPPADHCHVPQGIPVSKNGSLMGDLTPITAGHVPDPVPGEGKPSQHDTRGNQVLVPTRERPSAHGLDGGGPKERRPFSGESVRRALPIHPAKRRSPKRRIDGAQRPSLSPPWVGNGRRRPRSRAQHCARFSRWAGGVVRDRQRRSSATSAFDGAVRRSIAAAERRIRRSAKHISDRQAAPPSILLRVGGRSPYAARRRDPPTGGERYSRRTARRGAYCSVERGIRYTGRTGGEDESTGWEGQEKGAAAQ